MKKAFKTSLTALFLCAVLIVSCGKDSSGPGSCEVVNGNYHTNLRVNNGTSSGLILEFYRSIRIGDVPSGGCWLFALEPGDYRVLFEKTGNSYSRTSYVSFSVNQGQTYTIDVTEDMFN